MSGSKFGGGTWPLLKFARATRPLLNFDRATRPLLKFDRATWPLLGALGFLILLGGCASAPPQSGDVLDPRLGGPCDRLTLSWSAERRQLAAGLGEGFEPRPMGGDGELQLRIVRCEGRGIGWPPLSFAYYAIPVTADSVPLVVTSVPEDGWWSMPVLMADRKTTEVFAAMGYQVSPADIQLTVSGSERDRSVSSRIQADEAVIEVLAAAGDEATPFEANRSLVTESEAASAAFFGQESASRITLDAVEVPLAARMPYSAWGALGEPKGATLDRGLRFDRIYWRLPRQAE